MAFHAVRPWLARPGPEYAEAHLALDVEVRVYPIAGVLDEGDHGRFLRFILAPLTPRAMHMWASELRGELGTYERILVGNLEAKLDELVLIERILGPENVRLELQQVIILEVDKIVWVLLLEFGALPGHTFQVHCSRHREIAYLPK